MAKRQFDVLGQKYIAHGIYKLSKYLVVCHDCKKIITSYDDYHTVTFYASKSKRLPNHSDHRVEVICPQ